MATASKPSIFRVLLRRLGRRVARATVLVMAAAVVSALSGTGSISIGEPAGELPPRTAAELERFAQLPGDVTDPEDEEEEEFDPADTLNAVPPPAAQSADSTSTAPDTTGGAPTPAAADTLQPAPLDTLHAPPGAIVPAVDSTRTSAPDTLGTTILPTSPTVTKTTPPPGPQQPKEEPKKARTGLFGIHPIAILLGLAALHYALVHVAE